MTPEAAVELFLLLEPEAQSLVISLIGVFHKKQQNAQDLLAQAQALLDATKAAAPATPPAAPAS